ncbi:MAG: hypothetical protein ABSH05_17415 [Bryobacteraceae bacterium]|jgi:hypothetical protein
MIRTSKFGPMLHRLKRPRVFWRGSGLWLFLLIASERNLKAYADPGSGALIWQVLVAGAIGVLYYLRKITAFFRKKDRDG